MTLMEWAAGYAEELLAPLGDRWAHVRGVVRQARQIAGILPANEREVLVAAAYLHHLGSMTYGTQPRPWPWRLGRTRGS